ncbi:hypothetical protein O6H91_01G117500 [Diphasiastrum complanatum]|uniref:Uncharacterized protein n=1 Tax=Diphasiastrum complanatum TaxID=34168 RepID=A0ACC2EVD2_DIPCM|nr:hypothetical protein O6H91_01G117500 [Diphasiastrum complanatum]
MALYLRSSPAPCSSSFPLLSALLLHSPSIPPHNRLHFTASFTQSSQRTSLSSSLFSSAPASSSLLGLSRRCLFFSLFFAASSSQALQAKQPALPDTRGYNVFVDNLDGYSLWYPKGWIQVRGAGADIFFRDPLNLDENVMVNFSSPSSSRYKVVEDLGPPEEAAKKVLQQYLTEFMSTRLGVRRESSIVSCRSRVGGDGKTYYEIQVNVKSYANTNQLAVMPQDRVAQLEWDRRYLSVLGVENNRLYELRLQAPEKVFSQEEKDLRQIMDSFKVLKITV